MIFGAAIVELQLIGGAAAVVVIKAACKLAEVGLASELILVIRLGDGHIQPVSEADGQDAPFVLGVKARVINASLFARDEAAQHVVVLIGVAMPTANPLAYDAAAGAGGITGSLPIPIKRGATRTQQCEAKRKNQCARVHLREVSGRNASWQYSGERGIAMRARAGLVTQQFSTALTAGESLGFQ